MSDSPASPRRSLSRNVGGIFTDGIGPDVVHRRIDHARLRLLAELRFARPEATWADLAREVGVSTRTTERWRQTEQWEAAYRDAAVRHVGTLTPHAIAALKRAWAAGRGEAQALAVLQANGLLVSPQTRVGISVEGPPIDLAAVRERVLARLAQLAARADASPPIPPPLLDGHVTE